MGRRVVLGMLGFGAAGILFGAKVQSGVERVLRPVTLNDPTGLSSLIPAGGNFRIYSVTGDLPDRKPADWSLAVGGLVDRPLTLSYADVTERLPQRDLVKDFQCVTGWRVPDVPWRGVRLADVLAEAGVGRGATHVHFTSFDGEYTESLPLEAALRDDVLVAHTMEGKPVSSEHGGPVRLYVAPMYGYKSLKWLSGIEVVDHLSDPGFWEVRGYDTDAWVGNSNGRGDNPTS